MTDLKNILPQILVVGANHRSSSMSIRDRLFVEDAQLPIILRQIREAGILEGIVVSTCDRVEVQCVHVDTYFATQKILEILAKHASLDPSVLRDQIYALTGDEAIRQIFRVASSLDSLVVGEPQVLGQVKSCHRLAAEAGMAGTTIEAILQAAYAAAKRARNETGIGERPVTIAAAAARLAQNLHGDLSKCSGILLGTGEMGELVAEAMLSEGLGDLVVIHSVPSRAEALARELNSHVASYEKLAQSLYNADIVLTAYGSRKYLVTSDMIRMAIQHRRKRPVFLVDTSLPGDIDPSIDLIEDAFLYDLADLEGVVMDGRASRENEADKASSIIDIELKAFLRSRAERAAMPTIVDLRSHFENIRYEVLKEASDNADKATRLLVNRLLHNPSEAIRSEAADGGGWTAAEDIIRRIFGLAKNKSDNTEKNRDKN
jgi:glutamyl-tRNA reductase